MEIPHASSRLFTKLTLILYNFAKSNVCLLFIYMEEMKGIWFKEFEIFSC